VKRERCRYSGSPIKYSFSEKNQDKFFTVVEVGSDIDVVQIPIVERIPMVEVRGNVTEILGMDIAPKSYLKVILTQYELDAMNRLRSKYENVLELGMDIKSLESSDKIIQSSEIGELSLVELFQHFTESVGVELDTLEQEYIEMMSQGVLGER